MTAATVHRSNALVNPSPLPHIVEVLERLAGEPEAIRPGTQLARFAVALLDHGFPVVALDFALYAMEYDARWWDLAVEIGQWC